MVKNSVYKCNYCECLLRLRYQVGYFDIPVSIYCPKCNCHISGTIFIDNRNPNIREEIIGGSYENTEEYDYVVELATEFLVHKCKKRDATTDIQLSMFMRSNPFDDGRNRKRQSLMAFAKESPKIINIIENAYNLLKNNSFDLIKKWFINSDDPILVYLNKNEGFDNIISKLDAMLATKHYLNSLLQPIMPDGVFSNICDILQNKTSRIVKKHINSLIDYLKTLGTDYFETYLQRIPDYIVDYIKCINQLIPIYDNYNTFDSIDLNIQGISTINVNDLAVLYKKGYELLCDSIDLLIGIYNIENNGLFEHFDDGICDFSTKINSYRSKYDKFIHFTVNSSDLFDGIRGVLNNIIRNAEGHNSIKINGLKQEIVFNDKHKGRMRNHSIPFIEFGKNCIDVFVAILYIWEYYYQFLKLKVVFVDKEQLNYGKQIWSLK